VPGKVPSSVGTACVGSDSHMTDVKLSPLRRLQKWLGGQAGCKGLIKRCGANAVLIDTSRNRYRLFIANLLDISGSLPSQSSTFSQLYVVNTPRMFPTDRLIALLQPWLAHLETKELHFAGVAQYRKSMEDLEANRYHPIPMIFQRLLRNF
jgi:hypothetical protein